MVLLHFGLEYFWKFQITVENKSFGERSGYLGGQYRLKFAHLANKCPVKKNVMFLVEWEGVSYIWNHSLLDLILKNLLIMTFQTLTLAINNNKKKKTNCK